MRPYLKTRTKQKNQGELTPKPSLCARTHSIHMVKYNLKVKCPDISPSCGFSDTLDAQSLVHSGPGESLSASTAEQS